MPCDKATESHNPYEGRLLRRTIAERNAEITERAHALRASNELVDEWEGLAAGRLAELREAQRKLDEFDADKNTGECPYSRERLGCAVLHDFKKRLEVLTGVPGIGSKPVGAGHDFAQLHNYVQDREVYGDDTNGRCGAKSCRNWMTCTVSKNCQRGRGREIMVPLVETVIHEGSGDITLRCHSYIDR